ncbi:MAG TPA: hypothetical protein VLJ86_22430 [Ramlibacter sp.]|nr:hypothetical protein [Ramlibacter sp.]
MSEGSDRLERTRLAMIQHIQEKKEKPGTLKQMFSSVAAGLGSRFGRGAAPAAAPQAEADTSRQADAERQMERVLKDTAPDTSAREERSAPVQGPHSPAAQHERRAEQLFGGRFAGLGEAGREYWRNHPARLVAELATPAMSAYAQRHPARFLAFAAGAGALIYLARPWRLISVTGLAIAALRSPQLSSALISAFYGRGGEAGSPDE